jgi:hypothetical protein
MKSFFCPNIETKGRVFRGVSALALLVGGGFALTLSVPLGVALLALGIFVAFEALRGWCFLRACGLKTKF